MFIKDLQSLSKLAQIKLMGKRYPLSVTHIITTRCNFHCSYCNIYKHKEKEMTTEEIFHMIDSFSEMGMGKYSITGGEPLLRNDIGDIINHVRAKGSTVTLFTNGSLIKSRIDELKNLNILLTSFDGPKEVHDKNRQEGAYEKVIEAIKLVKDNGITVWAGVTLTKNNMGYISELLETAKEMDFKVLIQPVYNYEGSSAPKEQIESMSDFGPGYIKTIDQIIKKKKEGYPILNSVTYFKYMKHPLNQKPNTPCYAGKCYCAISPGGNVSPCYKIYTRDWPNGVKLGWKEAFLKLPSEIHCPGCFSYATTELNLFYSLHPETVYNTYFKMIKLTK